MNISVALAATAALFLMGALILWAVSPFFERGKAVNILAALMAGVAFWVAFAAIWVGALA